MSGPGNTQTPLSYKNFDLILNKCFEGGWKEFSSIIKYMAAKIENIDTQVDLSFLGPAKDFLDQLSSDEEAFFQFMKLAIDRNPSLSDELWVENLTSQNGENVNMRYETYFKVKTEFGMQSILPVLANRKHMRLDLQKTHDLDQTDSLELPLIRDLVQNYVPVEQPVQQQDQTNFIQQFKKAFNEENGANDHQIHPFSKYFLQYCSSESKAKMEDKIFLIEELANCLYLLLDSTVPPPFTSIKAVRRDHTMHRLARYFFSKYTLAQISQVLDGLDASLQEEFIFNLLQEDRVYLQENLLRNNPDDLSKQMVGELVPFNETFNKNLKEFSYMCYNKDIPLEEDVIQGNNVLNDPLQKLIQADDYFRNLTKRQVEEWYDTTARDSLQGSWIEPSFVSDIDLTFFKANKGNIIFDYYFHPDLKKMLLKQVPKVAN